MKSKEASFTLNLAALVLISSSAMAAGPLGNATVKKIDLAGNDIVFDATRNVFYLSVPSTAGFPYGNSVVTVDPDTAEIVHAAFVGSEPNKLAISSDGSRVYVGLDGAQGFCWWEPSSDTVSSLVNFSSGMFSGPSVADDLAVAPNDPHTVIISKNDVSSSAAGAIEVFRDNKSILSMNQIYGAESIAFSGATTLFGYDNYTSAFTLWRWTFDGTALNGTGQAGNAISGYNTRIKAASGYVFSDNGRVVSAETLAGVGTFSGLPGSPAVEPTADASTVYFLGTSGANLQLASFDRRTFLKLDTKTFGTAAASPTRSLVVAQHAAFGGERLGYVQSGGAAGIISILPPVFVVENFQSTGKISQLRWSSVIGKRYQVQWSADLVNWTTFITTTAASFSTTKTFNGQANPPVREFYRVIQE